MSALGAAPQALRAVDRLARLAGCVLFTLLALVMIRAAVGAAHAPPTLGAGANLLSKVFTAAFYGLVVWLMLRRDGALARAGGLGPRLTALGGSFALMLSLIWLRKAEIGPVAQGLSAVLILGGSILMLAVLARLGRSFSIMAEARRLVTTGPYRRIRHPLYLAEAIGTLGVLIDFFSWPALAVVVLQFACQVQRMRNEERVLLRAFPADYARYMRRTHRLVPGVW